MYGVDGVYDVQIECVVHDLNAAHDVYDVYAMCAQCMYALRLMCRMYARRVHDVRMACTICICDV